MSAAFIFCLIVFGFIFIFMLIGFIWGIFDSIKEKKVDKEIERHFTSKDYLWVLENCFKCGYPHPNLKYPFYYNESGERSVMDLFLKVYKNISLIKKIKLSIIHKLILIKWSFGIVIFETTPEFIYLLDTEELSSLETVLLLLIYKHIRIKGKSHEVEEFIKNKISYIENEISKLFSSDVEYQNELLNAKKIVEDASYDKIKITCKPDLVNLYNYIVNGKSIIFPEKDIILSSKADEELYIRGHHVQYFNTTHQYYVDGLEVPSVTTILEYASEELGLDDYKYVSKTVLQRAAEKGTKLHKEIEDYETNGIESYSIEFQNYLQLKEEYKFNCLENEQIVIFCDDNDKPIYAGRLDMVGMIEGNIGILDIKRTSKTYQKKVSLQLNLYRLAYIQSYGKKIEFLKMIRLRENVKELITFEINEDNAFSIIKKYVPKFKEKYSLSTRKTSI